MAGATSVFTRRAEELGRGIDALDQGVESAFTHHGITYTVADRAALDLLYELALLRAAREAILAGSQEYTILGRQFRKADFQQISKEIQRLEALTSRAARGGSRVRNVVPI